MTEGEIRETLPRIGVVMPDPLRLLGLQVLLGDGTTFEMIPLSAPNALALPGLELVLMDASSTEHPLELVASFHRLRPLIRLIVLGDDLDPKYIERVIGAGARGYLSHSAREGDLRMAIDVVRDGSIWAPRKVLSHLLETGRRERKGSESKICPTKRELEVLRLLMGGQANREIASAIGVDQGTVKAHLGRLMRKAGVTNRTALSVRAMELKWVDRAS